MLGILNLEEIHGLLLRIPDLVNLQERRDPGFVQEVKRWLATMELVLGNNRMPVVGNVAALRGLLTSAERGAIPAEIEVHGRPTSRIIRESAATEVLRRAGDLVSNAVREDVSRIAEAERLGRKVVALADFKGLIRAIPRGSDNTASLKKIWHTLSADPDIAAGAANLLGLIGPSDALIVLDRAITSNAPTPSMDNL
jgi:hypothetical protein